MITHLLDNPQRAYDLLRYMILFAGSMWALIAYQVAQRTESLKDYGDAIIALLFTIMAAVIMR